MRAWRTLEPHDVYGHIVTSYGPANHVRPGMLTFVENDVWLDRLIRTDPPAVVLCPSELAEKVGRLGHKSVTMTLPRDAFWNAFTRRAGGLSPLVDVRGYVAPSARVGSVAFKIHKDKLVPNIGGVMIAEGATVGEFTAVDAGITGESTEIYGHVDNLVHVAHSVIVGKGARIVAGSILGGWAEIGENAFVGQNCTIKDNVRVGANAFIGCHANVIEDVEPNAVMVGNPARRIRWRNQ